VIGAEAEPVAGASLRVLLLRDAVAYLAGAAVTDAEGRAVVSDLPEGEMFVLADAEGRTRASSRLVLGPAAHRDVRLRLRPADGIDLYVTDDARAPIAHAWVEIDAGDPLPFVGETGADGRARVGRLGPPSWRVRVGAQGHETVTQWVTKTPGKPVEVALRKLGALDVVVVDPEGRPAPGAEIMIVGSGLWPARRTLADAKGCARAADLPAGIYDLRATASDRVTTGGFGARLGRGEERSLTLVLTPGRRVSVRVLDGEGQDAKPVTKADVVLTEGGISSFPIEGQTDVKGGVTLGPIALTGGAYVAARADGFVPKSGVVVPDAAPSEVRVALVRGATLRGDVVDGRGFPVAGASIEVVGTGTAGEPIDETPERIAFRAAHFSWALSGPTQLVQKGELGIMAGPIPPIPHGGPLAVLLAAAPRPARPPGAQALPPAPEPWVTRSDGTFRAFPVPPGRVRAIARHPAYVEAESETVALAPAGEAAVHVVLHAGGTLEGRVLDSRRDPVGGARIELAAVHGSLERTTTSAQDGTFAFASVPAEISLSVSRPDAVDDVALRATLGVAEGERKEVELVLPEAREPMRVRVLGERAEPLALVQLVVLSLSPDVPMKRTLFTDRDGAAVFRDAVGLSVRVQATARGRAPVVREIAAAPTELDLEMPSGLVVIGRVTARGGHQNAEGAEVVLTSNTGAIRARTDKEGSYKLEDVAKGRARITVSLAGHVSFERTIDITPGTRDDRPVELDPIDLVEAGSVEGIVVDGRGDPVAGARVHGAVTDARGAFVLKDLAEGEVVIEAFSPERGGGRTTALVRAGKTTDRITITLVPDGGER
jgi:protocatechuate 3,4-dioxygenase beta subunit